LPPPSPRERRLNALAATTDADTLQRGGCRCSTPSNKAVELAFGQWGMEGGIEMTTHHNHRLGLGLLGAPELRTMVRWRN